MTKDNAIKITKAVILRRKKHLECIREDDRNHPDTTPNNLGQRMSNLLQSILISDIDFFKLILLELEPKSTKNNSTCNKES